MAKPYRLDSTHPSLAGKFRLADSARRRSAAVAACRMAVEESRLAEVDIARAVEILERGGPPLANLRTAIEAQAAQLDATYFDLWDENDAEKQAEALRFFSKARAASAVSILLADSPNDLHESIYEAIAAIADPSGLVQAVAEQLS